MLTLALKEKDIELSKEQVRNSETVKESSKVDIMFKLEQERHSRDLRDLEL